MKSKVSSEEPTGELNDTKREKVRQGKIYHSVLDFERHRNHPLPRPLTCHSELPSPRGTEESSVSSGEQVPTTLLSAVLILLLITMPFHSKLNQPVNQLRIRDTRSRPQLGIHADGCKSRHGIDLVQINLARLGIHEEVHARQTGAVHCAEGRDS